MNAIAQNALLLSTLALFLLVNLRHFWEAETGALAVPVFIVLALAYFVLAVFCGVRLLRGFRDGFSDKNNTRTSVVLLLLLALIGWKPGGLIDFEQWDGEDLLIAQREGDANCLTTLKLKADHTFREKIACFGIKETNGRYEIRNDTIFFPAPDSGRGEAQEYYAFAVIKKSNYSDKDALFRYRNETDTAGAELWIVKNEILK